MSRFFNFRQLSIIVIPPETGIHKQFRLPLFLLKAIWISAALIIVSLGYFAADYNRLRAANLRLSKIKLENQYLKGESQILLSNLKELKTSLKKVEDYSQKLNSLVHFRIKKVGEKTGFGPLSKEEQKIHQNNQEYRDFSEAIPSGLNLEKLVFKPIIQEMNSVRALSINQSHELQKLLASLSKKKSLLASTPTISPVQGWITSNFGARISPFTGKRTPHKGIDIAAPTGAPIYAPADGVVIFSGKKSGFGKFIMVAHGHGVVTRYGHNAQNMVSAGQKVKRGEQLAAVGMTGRTTGPHLHYEIWVDGKPTNPRNFILNSKQLGLPVTDFYF